MACMHVPWEPACQEKIYKEAIFRFDEMISQIKLDVAKVMLHLEHPKLNENVNQEAKITSTGVS